MLKMENRRRERRKEISRDEHGSAIGCLPSAQAFSHRYHRDHLAQCVRLPVGTPRRETFIQQWSVIPADIAAGRHWVTIVTAMFMHGGWMHIIGNMVFLKAFGPEIEDAMGPIRYLAFYLLGGFIASIAQIAVTPLSHVPNLGASGAIAGVMGAFLMT